MRSTCCIRVSNDRSVSTRARLAATRAAAADRIGQCLADGGFQLVDRTGVDEQSVHAVVERARRCRRRQWRRSALRTPSPRARRSACLRRRTTARTGRGRSRTSARRRCGRAADSSPCARARAICASRSARRLPSPAMTSFTPRVASCGCDRTASISRSNRFCGSRRPTEPMRIVIVVRSPGGDGAPAPFQGPV